MIAQVAAASVVHFYCGHVTVLACDAAVMQLAAAAVARALVPLALGGGGWGVCRHLQHMLAWHVTCDV